MLFCQLMKPIINVEAAEIHDGVQERVEFGVEADMSNGGALMGAQFGDKRVDAWTIEVEGLADVDRRISFKELVEAEKDVRKLLEDEVGCGVAVDVHATLY
jgi:hypothetical protein